MRATLSGRRWEGDGEEVDRGRCCFKGTGEVDINEEDTEEALKRDEALPLV